MTQTVPHGALPQNSTGEATGKPTLRRRKRMRWLVVGLIGGALLVWQWKHVWPVIPNWRASVALKNRDTEAATFWLQTAELGVSDHPETAFLRARCQRRLRDFAGVRRSLEKAFECGVPKQRLEREQWLTLAQIGQMREAEPHLPELFGNPGDDVDEICEAYSSGYFLLHRYGDAMSVLDAWLADYPENSYALLLRARVNHHLHSYHEAEKDLRSAVTFSPGLAEAHLELAEVLRVTKRPDEALPHYARCFGDAKVGVQARIGHGISLKMLGQTDLAREQLAQIVAQHPDHPHAVYELGLLELEAGDAQSAVAHLQRIKEINPANLEARNGLAQALQLCGRQSEAVAELALVDEAWRVSQKIQALEDKSRANPANVEVRFELGQVLFQIGRRGEGASWLQSVLEISPGHSESRRMLDDYLSAPPPSTNPQPQQPPSKN